ncbi:ATP synthase F1 subunit delta [Myxacorys almedinensis]|uniref:ATP synthase subunit delta n=1 Tax=Myxacorys almedinensis A TaxID=2690445 RepID=A0A8J8CJW8_9CYAN|nr:ATP synthase F1 subunit delta [Myxacorys almedinensis]NDJ15995.1 F0F1 ATP synthase subunit delta [Myxacorys almedinensis A]
MADILNSQVLEPYAQALMSLGQSNDLVDRLGEDVNSILNALSESSDLREFIANPLIKADAKKTVLRQVFGEAVHPFTHSFLMLLVDRRRVMLLDGICKQFQVQFRKLKQTVLAEVISTVELDDAQKDAIRRKVKTMTGAQQVELEAKLDPDLIGGVIIKVGSQVIDASMRGQLRRIGISLSKSA